LYRHTDGEFPRAKPVNGLTKIGGHRDIHLAEQAAEIFGT